MAMSTFTLTANPSPTDVMELKEQLLVEVQTSKEIIFNCEHLQNVTTPLVQLFLTLITHYKDIQIQCLNIHSEIHSALEDFGCIHHFKGVIQ